MFLITGGGSGIGQALAERLAERGKEVVIVGRRKEILEQTATFSPLISILPADISTHSGRHQIAEHFKDVSELEGLIHCAGIIEPIMPLATIDETSWQHILTTNLNAPLMLSQLFFDKLRHGRVLHIGSGAAYFPVTGWSGYCVSKAALAMLTRCWQEENADYAFASIMPGITDTAMQDTIRHADFMTEEKRDFFIHLKQENRLVSPQTVALFIAWLLLDSDRALYSSKEWDIYDTTHHQHWLVPPYQVPSLE